MEPLGGARPKRASGPAQAAVVSVPRRCAALGAARSGDRVAPAARRSWWPARAVDQCRRVGEHRLL